MKIENLKTTFTYREYTIILDRVMAISIDKKEKEEINVYMQNTTFGIKTSSPVMAKKIKNNIMIAIEEMNRIIYSSKKK